MIIHHNCAVKVINASQPQQQQKHMMKIAQKTDGFGLRQEKDAKPNTKFAI